MTPEDLLALGGFAGFLSTFVMVAFEAPFWRDFGIEGVVEWEVNAVLVDLLLGRDPGARRKLGPALAMHLVHGVAAGAVLAALLGTYLLPARTFFWLAGLLVSLFLWSLVPFLLRGSLERLGKRRFSGRGMAVSFASHVVFGLVLGLLLQAWV